MPDVVADTAQAVSEFAADCRITQNAHAGQRQTVFKGELKFSPEVALMAMDDRRFGIVDDAIARHEHIAAHPLVFREYDGFVVGKPLPQFAANRAVGVREAEQAGMDAAGGGQVA